MKKINDNKKSRTLLEVKSIGNGGIIYHIVVTEDFVLVTPFGKVGDKIKEIRTLIYDKVEEKVIKGDSNA